MASSITETQEQRNNDGTEDSPAMTIEFLRARLLSERSVSRAARQRADELAKRVMELEEHLKIVSQQRKKAEKATANVLAILENHGISDESEAFDSSSDQDGNDTGNGEETSDSIRVGDMPAYSSSEIESSSSMGRSLSWKNSKHSLNSFEQNKFIDSARRKYTSSPSYGSSPKRIGKSCRRIRRREMRSAVDGSQKDSSTSHRDDVQPQILEEGSRHLKENDHLENPVVGYEDMEGALENQEQLIGQYEAEEKAQREWEEKFTENKSCSPDLDDPGNHSDVTEERVEVKETGECVAPATNSPIQDPKPEGSEVHSNKEVNTPDNFLSPPHVDISLQKRESITKIVDSSQASEFEFPEIHHQVQPENQNHTSPNHNQFAVSSGVDDTLQKSLSPGSRVQVALVPHETTGSVGPVLEALQKAKLSLKQKVDGSQLVESGSSKRVIESFNSGTKTGERFGIPPQFPGLFRLPIDMQFETTAKSSSLSGPSSRLNLSSYYPANARGKLFSSLHMEPNAITSTDDQSRTVSSSSVESISRTHLDLQASKGLPFTSKLMYPSYPFLPDVTPRISFKEGFPASFDNNDVVGLSTSHSSLLGGPKVSVPHQNHLSYYDDHTRGVPPSTQFSFYDHNVKPNFR